MNLTKCLVFTILSLVLSLNTQAESIKMDEPASINTYINPLRAPVSYFQNKDGHLMTLGNFHGKVTILNFWSLRCKPCIIEMPSLNKLKKKFKKDKFALIPLLSSKDDVSKVRIFLRRYKLQELEYFIDSTNLTAESFKIKTIPYSYIFNKKGKLVAYVDGPINWLDKKNIKFIQDLINEK